MGEAGFDFSGLTSTCIMPVLFSRACEYAFRALAEMANQPDKVWIISKLAGQVKVPAPFLAKIFQQLVKGNILISQKGRQGGFSLKRQPEKICLFEVVEILDGDSLTTACAVGLPECGDHVDCPIHHHWRPIRESILAVLEKENIKFYKDGHFVVFTGQSASD